MDSNSSYQKEPFGDVFRRYILSSARLYKKPSLVKGISRAVVEEDLPKVKRLVESGADVNILDVFGNGPIHIAIVKNNTSILSYLLSVNGSSINHRNFLGETPLFKALMDEKLKIAEQLILAGADVNIVDSSNMSPLHLAVNNTRIAQMLIERGADVDAVDVYHQTPLYCAVHCNYLETMHMLMYYNADVTISNNNSYTAFILAMERRNVEMQEALFEYIADYEQVASINDNFSMLGLALIYDSPFTDEMILRGADVNNVNKLANGAFLLILHNAILKGSMNFNTFKLIWERMDFELVERTSVLGHLVLLESEQFRRVVDIFINSDKLPSIVESLHYADDFSEFVVKCTECDLPFKKFAEFFYLLLCHGYTPREDDLVVIFNYWGYSEMFQILLHMDIRRSVTCKSIEKIPTRIIHQVTFDLNKTFGKLVDVINAKKHPLNSMFSVVILRVLDHYVYPPLVDVYLKLKRDDCVSLKMRALPKVPSLLELARNQTREHIKKSYQVQNSCQLYTLINNLDIADYYKQILTFEVIIYRPTFNERDFRKYVNMLKMKHCIITPIREPLIESAIRNAIVKY